MSVINIISREYEEYYRYIEDDYGYNNFYSNKPIDLIKYLSCNIIDVMYIITYPKKKFRANLFPLNDRYNLIENIKLNSDNIIFTTQKKSYIEKLRAEIKKNRVHYDTNYSTTYQKKLTKLWDKKIFKGISGYFYFYNINVKYYNNQGDEYYTITANYIKYDTIETYFSTINADILFIIISKIIQSKYYTYMKTLNNLVVIDDNIVNYNDKWADIFKKEYPVIYKVIIDNNLQNDGKSWYYKYINFNKALKNSINIMYNKHTDQNNYYRWRHIKDKYENLKHGVKNGIIDINEDIKIDYDYDYILNILKKMGYLIDEYSHSSYQRWTDL